MNAESMFNKLGYQKIKTKRNSMICYSNKPEYSPDAKLIYFNTDSKTFLCEYIDDFGFCQITFLNIKELKAVQKQLKELKW